MSDDQQPVSGAGEAKPQKKKAEDNPWYLLATLYGVPDGEDHELRNKNRIAWNRYFAANLDDETRTKLIEEKRHPKEELTPFLQEELQEVATAFAKRCEASPAKNLALPATDAAIDFKYFEFEQHAFFTNYLFSNKSIFQSAIFSSVARFVRATFSSDADFIDATFSRVADFIEATFSRVAEFAGATFSGYASFNEATFSGCADFHGATCSSGAAFDDATFSSDADFNGVIFYHETRFRKATFGEISNFVNAEMKGETSFEGAVFKTEPPHFFGAKLHEGTVWRGIVWPKPKNKDKAGSFVDAYERLKLEMDRLKKHEDELDFFALELQSRRVLQEGVVKGSGLPIALYGLVSDYGRSYARPQYALFAVAAIGTLVLLLSSALKPWQSLGLSLANTFNVFGFRKDFFDPKLFENLPATLKILAAIQTILGTILLFLVGLGIRNKFRMK
jgi:hypothetical protein